MTQQDEFLERAKDFHPHTDAAAVKGFAPPFVPRADCVNSDGEGKRKIGID